jgi:hypothetical protein
MLLLQMTPGSIKFLTEQPMFFITGIWSSSLVKLHHYSKVLLGRQRWKGRGEHTLVFFGGGGYALVLAP